MTWDQNGPVGVGLMASCERTEQLGMGAQVLRGTRPGDGLGSGQASSRLRARGHGWRNVSAQPWLGRASVRSA